MTIMLDRNLWITGHLRWNSIKFVCSETDQLISKVDSDRNSPSIEKSQNQLCEDKHVFNQVTSFVTNIDEPESKSLKVGTQQTRCNFSRCYSQRRTVDKIPRSLPLFSKSVEKLPWQNGRNPNDPVQVF